MPCDLTRIVEIGRKRKLPVIEDAACAIGSEIQWQGRWEKIGKPHGDIACFSFHPRKIMNTGDGGMITTGSREWDAKFRLLRQHAMSVPDTVRHGASKVIFEEYPMVGYNYRMTDIQAAVGREQLKRVPGVVKRRREIADQYRQLLADVSGLGLPVEPKGARSNWQSFCVRLPAGSNQRAVMQQMLDAGISTRRGIMCSHREAAYADQPAPHALLQSEAAQDQCVILPLYPAMTEADIGCVVSGLREACRNSGAAVTLLSQASGQ
jgi:perosamine synthetase